MVVCTSRINLLLYSTMILMKPLHEICSRICILSANILNNSGIIIIDNSNNMSGVNGNKVYIISSSLCKVKSYNESHIQYVIVINSNMFVFLIFLTLTQINKLQNIFQTKFLLCINLWSHVIRN